MEFGSIANIAFLLLFAVAGGLGLWIWMKKKQEEGE